MLIYVIEYDLGSLHKKRRRIFGAAPDRLQRSDMWPVTVHEEIVNPLISTYKLCAHEP